MQKDKIVYRLKELILEQKFSETREELFTEDAICVEADQSITRGLEKMKEKEKSWKSSLEKIYSISLSEISHFGNFFSIEFIWDIQYKEQKRFNWKTLGVY